jgi:folate-dependent tRNA-U54 methylase TrmFO/GidA
MSGALTYQLHAAEKQFIEGVFVGVEGKFKSAFEGLVSSTMLAMLSFSARRLPSPSRADAC